MPWIIASLYRTIGKLYGDNREKKQGRENKGAEKRQKKDKVYMKSSAVTRFSHLIHPFLQLITQPFYCYKLPGAGWNILYFLSDMADMHHDCIITDTAVFPPHMLVEAFFA